MQLAPCETTGVEVAVGVAVGGTFVAVGTSVGVVVGVTVGGTFVAVGTSVGVAVGAFVGIAVADAVGVDAIEALEQAVTSIARHTTTKTTLRA